ncbi:MAG: RNA polymerase factor sigma-54 [Alphaproteobacteria bacterium]
MALTPKLSLRLSQTLVMTPQLQQAIKLLQLSNIELTTYIETELEQNPLLERVDDDDGDISPAADAESGPVAGDAPASEATGKADAVANLGADYDNMWHSDGVGDGSGAAPPETWRNVGGFHDASELLEQTPAEAIGLRGHLFNQLNVDLDNPADRVIGAHLIELLDDAGYLDEDLTPVAQRLSCGVGRIEQTLEKLQRFDPSGVFARSLRECLAIQLRERNRFDPAMAALLDNLDLLAENETEALRARCGVDAEDFEEMLAEVRSLNPKPGLVFDREVTQTVVPDVFLRNTSDGGWQIELNNDTLPRVLVNQRYYTTISRQAKTREEKDYLTERLISANWLVKALDQRANTILRVATELVRQQGDFFTHGVRHLRPLIMRDIAGAIEMHESTVSRVIANKYMATPRGVYEMRYFFTNAIASTASESEGYSSEAVRHRVKQLIANETPEKPLTDDRIVAMLRAEGIDIARRTVAKYREALHLPSSLARKRAYDRGR